MKQKETKKDEDLLSSAPITHPMKPYKEPRSIEQLEKEVRELMGEGKKGFFAKIFGM